MNVEEVRREQTRNKTASQKQSSHPRVTEHPVGSPRPESRAALTPTHRKNVELGADAC